MNPLSEQPYRCETRESDVKHATLSQQYQTGIVGVACKCHAAPAEGGVCTLIASQASRAKFRGYAFTDTEMVCELSQEHCQSTLFGTQLGTEAF
jgi:hypothetical protein